MKSRAVYSSLVIVLFPFLLMGCQRAVKETYTECQTVEDGGTGLYKAIMVSEPSLEAHTIFRPADLKPFGPKNPLPILVWGNGACANSPWEHVNFLSEIASHGYMVVAIGYMPTLGERYQGPMSTSDQQIEGLDWALAQNTDPKSPYYGRLNPQAICAAGMSCGGLQTLANCGDNRLKAIMICNSGLFTDPTVAMPNMPMPPKKDLMKIHTPVLYMLGGEKDIAYGNGMDDFQRIKHVPAFAANYPVGHGGTYAQPHGGEFAIVAIAWLDWLLKDDGTAGGMFVGKSPSLTTREGWTLESNFK
ncbi:MAG: alpha/beta hydrolase [Bacteroidaceae bacterium]|nr:alpha/beta hydrolase [Bacteroidaceae bacterium]